LVRLGAIQLLVVIRAAALTVALFGFYFFFTQKNVFASFGAMLIGGCALGIAFPKLAKCLSGEGGASTREKAFRSDLVAAATSVGIRAIFVAREPQSQPHECGSPVDTLFGYCVTESE
jgi:hypothetical protein